MVLKRIIIAILIALSFSKAQFHTVRMTQYGPVRGKILTSRANSAIEYLSFQGIQYATPPLGKLRFKEPQSPKPWTNIRCAKTPRDACTQFYQSTSQTIIGSEDCLYLNVFIPITAANNSERMPVMVWFHGGNWDYLTANDVGPDYFMEKPVVIVVAEFRSNVFGFLSTLDDNAKGNMGLKDQVFVLKWVQANIENFNGDPSRVTVFGSCAGSIAVIYHMMSPLSRGIGLTGSPLNVWALQRNPMDDTRRLLKTLEIDSSDNVEIVERLQAIDARTLLQTALNYSVEGFYTVYDPQPFAPIIEMESSTAFLSESSYNLLQSGNFSKIPLIMGFNSQEGEICWTVLTAGNMTDYYQNRPHMLIPESMNIPANSPCINRTLNNITRKYFPDGNYSNPQELIPYLSLNEYTVGILQAVHFLRKQVPLYFYYLSYVGSKNTAYLRPRGVGHTEEIQYMWYPQTPGANPNETAADRLTRERIVTMWTNFAAERNPTPNPEELLQNIKWPPVKSKQHYLDINSTLKIGNPIPTQSEMPFWIQQFGACGFPDANPNDGDSITD